MNTDKSEQLKSIYDRRFKAEQEYRLSLYGVLCRDFFQKYISVDQTVAEIAAGHCEFINTIQAKEKIAVDLNPDVRKYAAQDVRVILSASNDLSAITQGYVDVVYVSNFFEHISRDEIVQTLREIYRILKPGGKLLVLQPNYRYAYKDYYMFFDHITAIDHRSLVEVLEMTDFRIALVKPRFLPYTTKSRLSKFSFLLRWYLKMPVLHLWFGKQAFVVAYKQ
jgi:ubiquinone/menaquinone biosynthesis C-methylase UbiE